MSKYRIRTEVLFGTLKFVVESRVWFLPLWGFESFAATEDDARWIVKALSREIKL